MAYSGGFPYSRFAYNLDKTEVTWTDFSTSRLLTQNEMDLLNGISGAEALGYADRVDDGIIFVFTETRSIYGMSVYTDGGGTFTVSYSDVYYDISTTPWKALSTFSNASGYTDAAMIGGIQGVNITGVKALKITSIGATAGSSGIGYIHIYGDILEGSDRLAIIDPVVEASPIAGWFDWPSAPRGSSDEVEFRVKNLSNNYSASDITVQASDVGSPSDPAISSQLLFSADGGKIFYDRAYVDFLAPTQSSQVLICRRVTPSDADLGNWKYLFTAQAGQWEA